MLDDGRVLDTLGVEMDVDLFTQSPAAAEAEIERLGRWTGDRTLQASVSTSAPAREKSGGARDGLLLASWRTAIDGGSLLVGEPHLAGTARADVAVVSTATAVDRGLVGTLFVRIAGPGGEITLPLQVVPDARMTADTVWIPGRIGGAGTSATLGARPGDRVSVVTGSADAAGVFA